MGLDIFICFDNNDEIFSKDYYVESLDHSRLHSLSRTFCNFMCRKNVISGEPEFDQIARITSIDISPIYDMENYGHGEELDYFLETAETDEQREQIIKLDEASKEKLKGNLDKVLETIEKLIERLSNIKDLALLLTDNGYDTLENETLMIASLNDKNTTQASIKLPKALLDKAPLNITDLITGNKYNWDKEWNFVELSPELPFHLFLIY